jgi:hypothetical protein
VVRLAKGARRGDSSSLWMGGGPGRGRRIVLRVDYESKSCRCYTEPMMWRKKNTAPEIREVRVKIKDGEVGIPYRPGQPTTIPSSIPVIPKRILKLFRLE